MDNKFKIINKITNSSKSYLWVKDTIGNLFKCRKDVFNIKNPSSRSCTDTDLFYSLKIKEKHLNLIVLSINIKSSIESIIVMDEFNDLYKTNINNLLTGRKPSIRTALYPTVVCIKRCKRIHHNKYNFSKFIFNKGNILSIVICFKHGNFNIRPMDLFTGRGCKKCADELLPGPAISIAKHNPNKIINSYFIRCYNNEEEFYKIGLSNNIKKRMSNIPYKIEILGVINGKIIDLFNLEQNIKNKTKHLRYYPKIKFQGYTECFN